MYKSGISSQNVQIFKVFNKKTIALLKKNTYLCKTEMVKK